MKGPRSRHRFNVLRVWECPACQKRAFAPPQVVTRNCECQGKDRAVGMRLIEPSRVRPQPASPDAAQPVAAPPDA